MFAKDSRVENFLTHIGVTWRWVDDLSYKALEPNWDYNNRGRSQAKKEDAILEYASRMESGSSAPGVIVRGVADTIQLAVLDGVQRLCAGELRNYTRFGGYVVVTDSDLTASKIRVLANHLLAGHPEPTDWTRQKAVEVLIIEGGMSVEELMYLGGWTRDAIEKDKTYLDWSAPLVHIGGPDNLAKGLILNIAKHAKMDDLRVAPKPIAQFCRDLKKAKLTNGESEPFIKDFFTVNRKDRKGIFDQFEEKLADFHDNEEVSTRLEGRVNGRQKPDIKLRRSMRAVATVIDELLASDEMIPYMDEYYQLWNQIDGKLKQLATRRKAAKV